ncbi:peptidylprolyl isomerase [Cobetia marina]|jgi:peptidyl-prolyl cis-trans isomerase SurA|uniref:Chaperone SurA n=1 Tax=Cobetia marina TaxID=28258 RepID=A0ABU9GJG8_COBMA|nr:MULTISPECIES: peptidylprolyl isomerase [Cobetia]MDA5564939.1 peptidylprolyl isomerase [Cobetia sp. MMG027]MDH2292149.1 peptidylprolyl isomerase [Cobetia sp. 10Alg 146]MDH2374583.1 peptidylprolyl isomerase [Cobetia sp. 3AK]MDI6004839.1 peptidylprolyl isomerase [Cobetia pacifica]MDN2657282.1 peptidylprolyl isomerase [Cobetia sp. 14N.309.X.WAT.E.A4]
MRKTLIAPLGLAFALASLPVSAAELLDRVVAVVNKDAIMQSDMERRVSQASQQLQSRGINLPPRNVLERQVLDRMVNEQIQLQMAEQANLSIDDTQLNATLRGIAKDNGLSLEAFADKLEQDGMSLADVRDQVRRELLVQQIQQRRVASKVRISDREIDRYLNQQDVGSDIQYHLAHLLVALPQEPTPAQVKAARERADGLRQQIADGTDFAQVAAAESAGSQALSGGDLGWRAGGELPSVFADVVPDMQAGEVSQPLRSASGYHLVKLIEKRGAGKSLISQTQARHILIQPNPNMSDQQALERAESIRRRVLGGEDFAALAQEFSDDKGSSLKGGELGWVSPGQTVSSFETAMNALKVGEVSQPIKTRFGYHIIEVENRRQQDVTNSSQRDKVRKTLFQRKLNDELEAWQQQIRAEAYVDNRLDEQ